MENFNKPSKEQVRAWLMERRLAPVPLPDIDRIRVDLGWRPVGAQPSLTLSPAPAIRIGAGRPARYNNSGAAFARSGDATART